ncbi:hypothetical protein [Hoylesella nanceiensis]|nr:hypothetical protein [Hoylesella nanceiensis]MBF1421439.1 hypothetical protein [Hoylesella nanceiensis]
MIRRHRFGAFESLFLGIASFSFSLYLCTILNTNSIFLPRKGAERRVFSG